MREAGRAEVLSDALWKSLVLAEDDAEDERSPHSVRAASHGVLDSIAQAVSDTSDAATAPDLAPRTPAQDHMDPLARKPCTLVEAAFGVARLGHPNDRLDECAPGRRATDGK